MRVAPEDQDTEGFEIAKRSERVRVRGVLRRCERHGHVALRGRVANFVGLHQLHDADQVGGVGEVAVVRPSVSVHRSILGSGEQPPRNFNIENARCIRYEQGLYHVPVLRELLPSTIRHACISQGSSGRMTMQHAMRINLFRMVRKDQVIPLLLSPKYEHPLRGHPEACQSLSAEEPRRESWVAG
jgi:hypothetical protein